MGSADYLHNACVLICPFEGDKCKYAKYRLNGVGRVSQLYSHWQHCHKDNPAARVLKKRWRKVLAAVSNRHRPRQRWQRISAFVAPSHHSTKGLTPLGLTPLQVLKARTIPVDKLNALPGLALELSGSWMESQGGMEHGYEQLRSPSAHASDGDVWRCEPCEP